MLSEQTWHRRRLRKEARQLCSDERLIDFGLRIFTVEQDEDGIPIRPDGPKVVRVREPEEFGGIFDTRALEWVGESENPIIWMVSQEQRRILLGEGTPLQVLLEGGEGSGKTTGILARWLILHALRQLGRGLEWGLVAPVGRRLERARQAMVQAMPPEWYSWRQRDGLFTFAAGAHSIRLLSAHKSSEDEGSPIQSFDWAGAGGDETQDMIDIVEDIRARGRGAPDGRFPMMLTATIKARPSYRSFRDKWQGTPQCGIERLVAFSNPYVAPAFWEARRHELSPREFQRRIEAHDVGPERQTYPTWSRQENLRPVPSIGAEPITETVLSRWGARFTILGGHDPGQIVRVSLLARIYRVAGIQEPCYWIVDEVNSERSTTEEHAQHVLERLRTRWRCNLLNWKGEPAPDSGRVLMRADPWTDTGNDSKQPDKSVYTQFKIAGIRIIPARLKPSTTVVKPMQIPKDAGIEMVTRLLCNAAGVRRIFIACDEQRQPCAPKLVESLEMQERDERGKAETQDKDEEDLSHWSATLRYMLWDLEKPRAFRERGAA